MDSLKGGGQPCTVEWGGSVSEGRAFKQEASGPDVLALQEFHTSRLASLKLPCP